MRQLTEFGAALGNDLNCCGTLLATSRTSVTAGESESRELHSLAPAAAIQLLRSRSGSCVITDAQAERLVALCGRNALAITVIAGFLNSSRTTPQVHPVANTSCHLAGELSC